MYRSNKKPYFKGDVTRADTGSRVLEQKTSIPRDAMTLFCRRPKMASDVDHLKQKKAPPTYAQKKQKKHTCMPKKKQ